MEKPQISPDAVREFVIAGHGNLGRVREMLDEEPGLLNACWDWGAGDFETALEGAGHMGGREIARFLISRGARMNLPVAAMLGELQVVKSILTAFPNLIDSTGAHGIPLMTHAKAGGKEAQPVLEYLESLALTPSA